MDHILYQILKIISNVFKKQREKANNFLIGINIKTKQQIGLHLKSKQGIISNFSQWKR